MKQYIEIVADTNDADYITQRSPMTARLWKKILPMVKAIAAFKPYTVKYVGYDGW